MYSLEENGNKQTALCTMEALLHEIIHIHLCTWSIQSLKAETLVKTVGFFSKLQPSPETKLAMPWTSQDPSVFLQLRGPPESPWTHN